VTAGSLVVVGTPIGNLGDLSPRAVQALATADAIACEDTRRTGRLLTHAGLPRPPLLVANEHTELARTGEILDRLARGQRVALVSDAGMPTVSDPGRRIVDAVARAGFTVAVVPGPVAATTALAVSGFEADRFVFEGFLPRKGPARADRLSALAGEERTMVLYEAPHRLRRTLDDLVDVFGPDRAVVVVRELTKLHEEVLRLRLGAAVEHFAAVEPRGEVAVVVAGARPVRVEPDDAELADALAAAMARGLSRRDAVAEVVAATGTAKRRVYDLATGEAGGRRR
jgi:16S rRNA (cytidine1402-2'-O)-methyltransferase